MKTPCVVCYEEFLLLLEKAERKSQVHPRGAKNAEEAQRLSENLCINSATFCRLCGEQIFLNQAQGAK